MRNSNYEINVYILCISLKHIYSTGNHDKDKQLNFVTREELGHNVATCARTAGQDCARTNP